jgi:hypothetical protein
MTSFLFFGNIMDNITNHKRLCLICNFTLGLIYTIYGVLIYAAYDTSFTKFDINKLKDIQSNMDLLINMVVPSI